MSRKATKSTENGQIETERDDDGRMGAFLDSLPELGEDDEGDEDESDDDGDDGDDEDGLAERSEVREARVAAGPSGVGPSGVGPSGAATSAAGSNAAKTPGRPRGRPRKTPEATLPVSPVPRGIRGPRHLSPDEQERAPSLNVARSFQANAYQEIDSLLASLNFATREYEVRLERLDPDVDENGVRCAGHLHTYKDRVSIEDISKRFRGGTYLLKIFGPHPTTGRPGIIKQERFTIAGDPAPMRTIKEKDEGAKRTETSEILRAMSEANERNQQRVMDLIERQQSNPSVVAEILPVVTPIIEKLLAKNEQSTIALLELQREERRAEERRREEEKKAEEDRRREEREERRREEDRRREEERRAEERRREDERKAEEERRERLREEKDRAREERELERERAREERERLREEMRQEAAEKQRQHERDMAAQAERLKQDQQRQQEFLQMMQNFQQAQMEMITQRAETGGVKAVTEQLIMLKQLSSTLTGEDTEPSKFERFTEGLQNVVQTVMPVAQQVLSTRRSNPAPQPQVAMQTAAQAAPRPVVVDLGPRMPALPNPSTPPVPAMAGSGTPATVTANGVATEATTATTAAQSEDIPNDLTAFVFPTEEDDLITAGTKLIKSVDLAIQQNFAPAQILNTVLLPYGKASPLLQAMTLGLDDEQLLDFIESNVPGDWAILSPKGEETVLKAFELWAQAAEQGVA